MVVTEIEGGGVVHVPGRVRGCGHSDVPSCVAAPAAGRADRCGSSPTSTDGGQSARHRSREESGSARPEQTHRHKVPLPQDCVDGGQIVIEFVETSRQLADVLSKPLYRLRLTELKKMIDMDGVLGLTAGLEEEWLSNLLLPCMNARQG